MIRALLLWLMLAGAAYAVQPDEILDDPALEMRARAISKGLRCLVCRNESIDESHAELARDLRLLLRERLVAGDSDDEAVDFIVSRYGEYVLLNPRADGVNLILWIAGPTLLLLGLGITLGYLRRQHADPATETLTDAEKARLSDLLKD